MKFSPTVTYTLYRLALLLATFLVLVPLLGRWLPLLLVLAIAFLVSGVLSFWLLAGQRAAMAGAMQSRLSRMSKRMDQAAAKEDAAADAAAQQAAPDRRAQHPQGVDNGSAGVVDSVAERDDRS